jgi:hypothetical protein
MDVLVNGLGQLESSVRPATTRRADSRRAAALRCQQICEWSGVPSTAMVTVRETWNDYSKGRRRTFCLFAFSGLCLFAAGVVGDFLGWWTGLAFVPNALTSLSGFFVGAPIALVLLSTFQAEREMHAQRDKIAALSNAAWESFAENVYAYCSQARQTGALGIPANGLSAMWDGVREKTRETLGNDSPSDEDLNELLEFFAAAAEQFDAALVEFHKNWPSSKTLSLSSGLAYREVGPC